MKTNINIDNYEAYLLDQMEGNISPEDTAALEAFLQEHPALQAEAEGVQLYYLEPAADVLFPNKEALKKKAGGRVVGMGWNTRWYYAAAAAAIIGVVVFVWMLRPTNDLQNIAPLADQPSLVIPVDTNQQESLQEAESEDKTPVTSPDKLEKETPAPSTPPLRLHMPTQGNTEEIAQVPSMRERNLPEMSPLQKTRIAEVDLIQNQFHTEEVAMYEPIRPAMFTPEESNSFQEQGNKLLNTILSNEMARNFLPEAVEEEVPNPRNRSNEQGDNTIILEVPKKGKQLIDNILNR